MHIFFQSFILVALTEMGDKTQLLALVLASRYRKPWTILAGVFTAIALNHLLAASVGTYLSTIIPETSFRYILAALFVGFAVWMLIPEKEEDEEATDRFGPYLTSVISFFLAEMGDKTQIATVALAIKFQNLPWVTLGTTAGVLASDALAIFFGIKVTKALPRVWIRRAASILYIVFAAAILF